ncbi:hypothetical protein SAMN04488029_1349 [Reichenbachiella faecimaris]|uniref:Uncharacterized protein n=1 Tax=Reichenbachiella faecimaris TaxID=692418 RepID=A0A1W2G9G6_REIFA|nr:DUF6090 family protein [Reichenbachiella faecimaris]SMD32988.1 hypothetical protein SAMN04488029_1349 [Reichenbachiella faecimaris]
MKKIKINWRYAIGEFLIVVAGILVAFQLNNWSQSANTRNLTLQSLNNLVSDLKQDSIQFGYHKLGSERTAAHLKATINCLKKDEVDSLEYNYQKSRTFVLAVLHNSAFESINQLGLLSNIEDEDLRYSIQYYYNFIQPNVVKLREFEFQRYEETMGSINTDAAIIMEEASWDDLPLDYKMVKQILLDPTNFKKLYQYGKVEEFLVLKANEHIEANRSLLEELKKYIKS